MDEERLKANVSVALLLTHGKSGRLFLTRHGVVEGQSETWGLIAGGVREGEDPWEAMMREAGEEAGVSKKNVIFVRGRDTFDPHVALVRRGERVSIGLVYSATYSGPKVPIDGWEVRDDNKVDRVELFGWRRILKLLDNPNQIYKPEFNQPQLVRWLLKNEGCNQKRIDLVDEWLFEQGTDRDNYVPPYNQWTQLPKLRGDPRKTNFARRRYWQGRE